jgi:holo-[acyl-carrier protein] synthase
MIAGLGTDIVDVADFARRYERGSLDRIFSDGERAYAEGQPRRRIEILAARWAAKEAFAKALGCGLRAEWRLQEIEVVHDDLGRPGLKLGPAIVGLLPAGARVHLSLSHIPSSAVAVVIIEVAG